MSAIKKKKSRPQQTCYLHKNSSNQLDKQIQIQTQKLHKQKTTSLNRQKQKQSQDKVYKFQQPLLTQKKLQQAKKIKTEFQKNNNAFQFQLNLQNQGSQDQAHIRSDQFYDQSTENFNNQTESRQNVREEFKNILASNKKQKINKGEIVIQQLQDQDELYSELDLKSQNKKYKQLQVKELEKSKQKTEAQQHKKRQEYFLEENNFLQYASNFNFRSKTKKKASKRIDYFMKFTLNDQIMNLAKTIIQNYIIQNQCQKIINSQKTLFFNSFYVYCFMLIALKSLYQRYSIRQICQIIGRLIQRSQRSLQHKFNKLFRLSQKQIIQSLKHHTQTSSFFKKKSKSIQIRRHFLKHTVNEEVINLAKMLIAKSKVEFDLQNQKKPFNSSDYSLYEDCLIIVTVKQQYLSHSFKQIFNHIAKLMKKKIIS